MALPAGVEVVENTYGDKNSQYAIVDPSRYTESCLSTYALIGWCDKKGVHREGIFDADPKEKDIDAKFEELADERATDIRVIRTFQAIYI